MKSPDRPAPRSLAHKTRAAKGYTLVEMVVVFLILAFIVTLTSVNVVESVRRVRVDEDLSQFARTLRKAADYAAFSGTNIAVVLEVTDGYYTIFKANPDDRYSEFETEPIIEKQALKRCYIDEIEFEDGTKQYSGELILKATPKGWTSSVVMNFLDDHNNLQRFLRCDRFTTRVIQSNTPLYLLLPREEVSMNMPIG